MQEGQNGNKKTRTIAVEALARVEGEGGMYVKVVDGRVEQVELRIFEPPRFFEAFLQGRRLEEAPDITARICGICPVAYQMSSCHAMEGACGVKVEGALRELRRLLYCGEWIQSHALHIYMLHAPDFLNYPSVIELAADHPEAAERGLKLKKTGNDLMDVVGGRAVHPINVRVGGFYRAPSKAELRKLIEPLRWAADASEATVELVAGFDFPDMARDYEYVSLRHPDEYPYNEGRLVSNKGLDIDISEFNDHFEEKHVPHSTSLHCRIKERGTYHVGPLARYSLNFDKLTPRAQQAALKAGLKETCYNPFKSIIVRAVETLYACEEAVRIIEAYEEPEQSFVPVQPRTAIGHGCTEAPRGMLYHQYAIDDEGLIQKAQIVPPTSQNQPVIEEDLRAFVQPRVNDPDDTLTWQCEQAIRNYDPCISCSCHFLRVEIDRT